MQVTKPQQDQTVMGKEYEQLTTATGDEDMNEDACKFCYQTEKQSSQKLISPCGCCGSLKHVHKQCLKKWLSIEANRRQGPLAEISFKLRKPDLKCKLCTQQIVFENQLSIIERILRVFQCVSIIYYLKRVKYYLCISVLGLFAINYFMMRFFIGRIGNLGSKVKDNSIVSLIVLSLILILLELTFIEVKWNANNLQITVPLLMNK